jgi:hypothetical protein
MPPTQTIHFALDGGPISVIPSAGQGAPGSYGLLVVEHDGLTLVPPSPWNARFSAPATDMRGLPGTAQQNDGRILDLVASVGLMDATRAYAVHLTVVQDGKVLATASDTGQDTGTGPTHESELLVVLSGAAPVMALNASLRSLIATSGAKSAAKRVPSRASRIAAARKDTRAQVAAGAKTGGGAEATRPSRTKHGGPKPRERGGDR